MKFLLGYNKKIVALRGMGGGGGKNLVGIILLV